MRGMGPEPAAATNERSLRDYYQPLRDQAAPEMEPDDPRLAFREVVQAGGVEAVRAAEAAAEADAPGHPSTFVFADSDIPEF